MLHRLWVVVLIAFAIVTVITTVAKSRPNRSPDGEVVGKCFPTFMWDRAPRKRPCVRIERVGEDGSAWIVVRSRSGKYRYSVTIDPALGDAQLHSTDPVPDAENPWPPEDPGVPAYKG